MALTVKEIENASLKDRAWKLWDERGLYLLISKAGSRTWQFKYTYLGKEKKMSLGAYPEVSLKAARAKRDEARAQLSEGKDPSQERQIKKLTAKVEASNTFGAIAREYLDKCAADGLAEVTLAKSEWLLAQLEPRLGRMPVREITVPMLLTVLQEVEASGRLETARRLRSFAGRVIKHAVLTGRAEHNPAPMLQRVLKTPKVRHHPAIIDPEGLGALLKAIDAYEGFPSTNAALRPSPHLFQRPGEIRAMQWSEIDLERGRWTIPASRMKMREPHVVPLSRQATAIIRSMTPISGGSAFVFPAFHSMHKPLSENTINQALRRMGYAGIMIAHGFRSTASSLLNESGRFSPDIIEHALAHRDPNAIRAIYNRTSYWNARVDMMQAWSDMLDVLKSGRLVTALAV
ncbi:integrase arm-type DNA-binding domain-containing protein [Sphingomonas sp. ST-64]|uniref:Integrase arm-type DNA-binding domain-containing protein n=1 Tax=Sphingomonas plantiphila TaxID=3163295 RepID=A0ABW8YKC7_9SPHN